MRRAAEDDNAVCLSMPCLRSNCWIPTCCWCEVFVGGHNVEFRLTLIVKCGVQTLSLPLLKRITVPCSGGVESTLGPALAGSRAQMFGDAPGPRSFGTC
jgi:hypothetical protein